MLQILDQNITSHPLLKIVICLAFLLLFFRLEIYEAIAAVFWQSASYVSLFLRLRSTKLLRLFSDNLPAMFLSF